MIYVQVILFQLDLFHTKSQVNGGHRSRKSLKRWKSLKACKSRAFLDHQLVHGVHLSCLFQKRAVKLGCDDRKLNKITEVDSCHIPLISEIIERVRNSSVLSKMDMCKGFHQVAMTNDAREKTAIVTPFGKMEYSRMPFGLVNATSTFQRLMDIVLDWLQLMCSAYVDDIIVYSGSWEEHLKDIDTMLGRLKKAGLTAKPSKCEWRKQYLV